MCVQSLRLGRFSYIQMVSPLHLPTLFSLPFSSNTPSWKQLRCVRARSKVAGSFVWCEHACVGVLMVDGQEAFFLCVTLSVAIQLTLTVLVVAEPVLLATSLVLLVDEGVPIWVVILLSKVIHEREERVRCSVRLKLTEVVLVVGRRLLEVTISAHHLVIVLVVEELTSLRLSVRHLTHLLALGLLSDGHREGTRRKVVVPLERRRRERLLRTGW